MVYADHFLHLQRTHERDSVQNDVLDVLRRRAFPVELDIRMLLNPLIRNVSVYRKAVAEHAPHMHPMARYMTIFDSWARRLVDTAVTVVDMSHLQTVTMVRVGMHYGDSVYDDVVQDTLPPPDYNVCLANRGPVVLHVSNLSRDVDIVNAIIRHGHAAFSFVEYTDCPPCLVQHRDALWRYVRDRAAVVRTTSMVRLRWTDRVVRKGERVFVPSLSLVDRVECVYRRVRDSPMVPDRDRTASFYPKITTHVGRRGNLREYIKVEKRESLLSLFETCVIPIDDDDG